MTKQEEIREEFKSTLFSNTRKQEKEKEEKEKEEMKRRKNELLNILGDRATNADIIYRTPEELEKRIEEEGLGRRLASANEATNINAKNTPQTPIKGHISIDEHLNQNATIKDDKMTFGHNIFARLGASESSKKENNKNGLGKQIRDRIRQSEILQGVTENMIGGNYDKPRYLLSRLSGRDTQGMLNLAHGEENMYSPEYLKDTIKLKNYDDPAINKYKDIVKNKVKEQFKDYGYNDETIKNIKGYYFKDNSELSQRMLENKDFRKIIQENRENILSNKDIKIEFPKHGPLGILWNNNFKNSIGRAQLLDYYIDNNGNCHIKMLDTYDFNRGERDFLNRAGAAQMDLGNLVPYFSIFEVKVPREELDKIWKDKIKKASKQNLER